MSEARNPWFDKTALTGYLSTGLFLLSGVYVYQTGSMYGRLFFCIGLGAFGGWITNHLAILALFDYWPRWFRKGKGLPCTGVLLDKKDDVVDSIVERMEDMFTAEVVVGRLKEWSEEIAQNPTEAKELADGVRGFLRNQMRQPELKGKLKEHIESELGSVHPLLHTMIDADLLTHTVMKMAIRQLRRVFSMKRFPEMLAYAAGRLESDVTEAGAASDSTPRIHLAKLVTGKAIQLVSEELHAKNPANLRDEIQRVTREHLGWLEVYGGILGGGIGVLNMALYYI